MERAGRQRTSRATQSGRRARSRAVGIATEAPLRSRLLVFIDRNSMAQSDYAASGITLPPALAGRWPRVSAVDLAITLVFALLVVAQIAHHEMWRDEIHTWGMVLASPSLSELFVNLRY